MEKFVLKQRKMDSLLDLNKKVNVAYINTCTETEGPYKRVGIWFQGCDILCKGCCNPDLQPLVPRHIITIKKVIDIILDSKADNGIEGVTLLGGEPTLQDNLGILCGELKNLDIGIILFTGKRIDEIDEKIRNAVDLIIDGSFEPDNLENERNLIGSKNQIIHLITERYSGDLQWFYDKRNKKIEINYDEGSGFFISGDVI